MKKKQLIFTFIIMALLLTVPLCALDVGLYDTVGLISDADVARFDKMAQEIAAKYNFDLIILIIDSLEGKNPIDYSWDELDSVGLKGTNWDGCLLLQATQDRDYCFTASGRGEKILNKAAYDKLEKDVVACLRKNDYSGAYETFSRTWDKFLLLESQGKKYNFLRETTTHAIFLAVAWIISLLIGLGVVSSMKKQMNTALPKTEADKYIIPGSLALTQQSDRFLYSTTTKTRKSSSSSSSGGGSSRSGGGRSSRSGKY